MAATKAVVSKVLNMVGWGFTNGTKFVTGFFVILFVLATRLFFGACFCDFKIEACSEIFAWGNHIDIEGKGNRQYATLYLAITENNLVSKVRGGDNAGVTFNHQNLVRKWLGPFSLNSTGKTDISTSVMLDSRWELSNLSVVAVVQNLDDGFVLQGLKLPLSEHLDH